jgi:uncharacterized protein YidB (DUF937 family)
MGILDSILGAVKDQAGNEATAGGLLESVIGMMNDPQVGGLSGLIEKFSQGGLAEQVTSWVSKGENLPISAEQLQAVLGSSFVQDIAAKLGINTADVAGSLAGLLPQVIDKLTPDGEVPGDNNLLEIGLKGLSAILGNKSA